ncbi:MAG TPA: GTP cyclohydrolase MptA [Candidatus Thermoplasmatota archaeon]|jgi:GTP cyclohydrolase-4|nr:GTP cyclohydrolase MptA [Candidatus Thermoplasmatota archaeon]
MQPLPDVQALRSTHDYKLTRVGVTGIRKPVQVKRPSRKDPITLVAVVDAFVDLPGRQRGIHMSRNVEAINEAIDQAVRAPVRGLEDLAGGIASDLLKRHDYASIAEVDIEADYFLERTQPSGQRSLEPYNLLASARARRGQPLRCGIGALVTGINACPCAMETARQLLEERGMAREGPNITHNQRNRTLLLVETTDGISVEADDLIDLAEAGLSAPTYEILKRGDEARLVIRAHERPLFVEDVVREVLDGVVRRYPQLPPDTLVLVRSEAEESIHKHNAFAERVTTLGELRAPAA